MTWEAQPTNVLMHTTRSGSHYDWLMGDPTQPDDLLWTARLQVGPWNWRDVRQFGIEPIGGHRRLYLDYEGPLGEGRGRVQRVDAGQVEPAVWKDERKELVVSLRWFTGRVTLTEEAGGRWLGRVVDF